MSTPGRLHAAFMRAIEYLAVNAQRAHPERDRRKGRLATGLKANFGSA